MQRIVKYVSICALILFSSLPVFAAGQWYKIQSNQNYAINHCFFLNTREVWAVGSQGYVLKSTDGGFTWSSINVGNDPLYSIFFIDSDHGWIAAKNGNVFYTANGSADLNSVNWGSAYVGNSLPVRDVYFINANKGLATGGGLNPGQTDNLFGSTNGGITWGGKTLPGIVSGSGIAFSKDNSQFGVEIGNSGTGVGIITVTNDQATSWSLPFSIDTMFGITRNINKVSVPSASSAWIAGNGGNVYWTFDGGTNWRQSKSAVNYQDVMDIFFINENNGWFVGTKDAYATTNRGANWTAINLPNRGSELLNSVSAMDADHVCIVGNSGLIYVYAPITPASLTFPSSIEITAASQVGAVDISWGAATDPYGISGYQIYRAKKSEGSVVVSDNFNDNSLNYSIWSPINMLKPGSTYTLTETNGKLQISGTAIDRDNGLGLSSIAQANPQKLISISADIDLTANKTSAIVALVVSDPQYQSHFDPFLAQGIIKGSAINITGIGFGTNLMNEPNVLAPTGPTGEVKALIYKYGSVFYNGAYKGKGPASLSGNLYYGLFTSLGSSDVTTTVTLDNFNATEYPIAQIASVGSSATSYHDASVEAGASYFYAVIPVNNLGHTSGSNIVETAVPATTTTPASVQGTASIRGDEVDLFFKPNTFIAISSAAVSATPISMTVYGPNWSEMLDVSSATSIKQSATGDISVKWKAGGKIANLDKGIYPVILKVGGLTQKIYLVKY